MARPIEFNDDVVRKLEEVFSLDGTVSEACFYAGISRQTYYSHVKSDGEEGSIEKELYDRFEALRERPILKARQTIVKGLDEADNARWYLERKRKSEFASRQEVTGKDGKDLVPETLTQEEKDKLLNLIK